jgi:DNA topoisomerase-6 subunit B
MTSFQSTLGEEPGIAEELAESQRAISIAEFFEKNKHMLGFDSGARGIVTAVKEAVDNALDACEEADVHPDVYVEIEDLGDYYRLVVEDNGPGITKEQLPKVFGKLLYGSRFHKRQQSLTPDQQVLVRRDGNVEAIPIGVLCDAYLSSNGEATGPITDDIEVPSFDRETHEVTWQPVTHAIRHETDGSTYEITTQKGRTVEVTDDHSLFTVTARGETREVSAADLEAGDAIIAPAELPTQEEPRKRVNLLEYVTTDQLEGRRVYVYGFERADLETLTTGEKVRKKPSPESSRERTYYRYEGVDVLKDSLESNYLEKGYLPAEKVLELGWEEKAAGGSIRTYQVGGDPTEIPVSVPLDADFMRLLGYYVAEGHADDRQVGFTFGSHENDLIEATEGAVAGIGGSTTTVERPRNSTRVKAFGWVLSTFLENVCGDSARTKRIPGFVFEAPPGRQRTFIAALYEGDGSDSHPSNELSHTTTSETLARQLSVLWNMQSALASTEVYRDAQGYGEEPTTQYRTKVYGEDASLTDAFETDGNEGQQGYKRVPTTLLSEVAVESVDHQTVPDSIPGLLLGAGVGSSIEHAAVYQSLIEDAIEGEYVRKPRYVHNMKRMGLLDADHRPTEKLEELWDAVTGLQGITERDVCFLPVEEVEETDPPEYVYDVSVPGKTGYDENFVVVNEGPLFVKNSRGQQGIGISAAVLYSQLTSGKPAKITSRTQGSDRAQYFELVIDTDENEPEIKAEDTTTWDRTHGTRIELEMEANMRARSQLHDYVKNTAVVNPHARIELDEPGLDEPMKFERVEGAQLPAETEEIRPHPHGVELGEVQKMMANTDSHSVSGFLQNEFTRVGKKTADSIIDRFRDYHYGREVGWSPPGTHEDADLAVAVRAATSNKGANATKAFAQRVADGIDEQDHVAGFQLEGIVEEAAESVEEEFGSRFGDTVRDNAVEAAWRTLVGADEGVTDRRAADCYGVVDEATTDRKSDAAITGLSERLATRIAGHERGKDRLTSEELEECIEWAADRTEEREDATFGDTARENVLEAMWQRMETVPEDPPKIRDLTDDRDATADLVAAMRDTDIMAPPTDCLSPITDELVEAGLRKEYDADFYAASTRDADVTGGDPFIVEAGIAYGGELEADGSADVLRFANRVPLVYQRGACATTDVIKSIGWRNYKLDQPGGSGIPNGPAVVMVHVASTNVPFTSESKDAVANVPEIEHEIELAVREAARELKSYLKKRQSMEKRRRKQDVLADILPRMAEKVAQVADDAPPDIDDAMARIMNNVLVERRVTENGDRDRVVLTVENHTGTSEDLEVTDIVSTEPTAVSDGASVVEVEGEYFLKWQPTVEGGEEATVAYEVPGDATFDVTVDGVEDAKLTVSDS